MKRVVILKRLSILLFFFIALMPFKVMADSICAEVKIEIKQELTLERQAFDAHMRINNGLTHTSLQDVKVDVTFEDEDGNEVLATNDPDNTDAKFFIRQDSGGISGFSDGQWNIEPVAPASSSDLHWLIIPAPGSADGIKNGKLYYVGAVLTYSIGGDENKIEVTPDYIFVKPLPQLELDYFLEENVYGDDAFTPAVEAPVPFTLGVRVKNFGKNTANNLKIDSAQPKIVENEQGLAIGFEIEDCQVNGELFPNTLLADFGDIEPDTAGVARWLMTCSLSGRFTEFDAIVTHADELGGELTSLLKQENLHAHLLVKDVLVDLAGRDQIQDFLAKYGDLLRVYESELVDTIVTDQSLQSNIEYIETTGTQIIYKINTTPLDEFIFVKLTDPRHGDMLLKDAIRNDGKQIQKANRWLSKERKADPSAGWDYYVNIFDVNATGSYKLTYDEMASVPHAPVLQAILDKTVAEEERISFLVEASDADGTIPTITLPNMPVGATLTDEGNGRSVFDWTPAIGQAGDYTLTFIASDGELQDKEITRITVFPASDKDGDGMEDQWEQDHFGNLDRNGAGDFDNDGIMDYDEFILGTDPEREDNAPSIPRIQSPLDNTEVTVTTPLLTIENSVDDDNDDIFYDFELYSDINFNNLVTSSNNVPQGIEKTTYQVTAPLNDNSYYYWRVRATDKNTYSIWIYGKFFVNTVNETPEAFFISYPISHSDIDTEIDDLTPILEITNSIDPDEDVLKYSFEVYSDEAMTTLVASVADVPAGLDHTTSWQIDTDLVDNTKYYWLAKAIDEDGLISQTELASFTTNTLNHAPRLTTISLPALKAKVIHNEIDLVVENGTDADGDALTYYFEIDKAATFNSGDKISSDAIAENDTTTAFHVQNLMEDTWYYWRAKASDGSSVSSWIYASFFVNKVNDIPLKPVVKNPDNKSWSEVLRPEISVHEAKDSDGYAATGKITYYFELYSDPDCKNLVQDWESTYPRFTPIDDLENNTIYYFKVMAMDEYNTTSGYTDPTLFFARRKNHDPEISGTPATSINEDQAYSFIPAAYDSDPGDSMIFSITNKPLWTSFNTTTGELTGTPVNDDVGISENIIITVTDAYGGADSLDPFSLTVINVNDPPQISGTPLISIDENLSYSFIPSATDVDVGDVLTFSIENKPPWMTFNTATGELSGLPLNDDVGIFENIIITVTDLEGAKASLAGFNLTVIDTNTKPVAVDDTYYPHEDATFTVAAPGILGNDSDADIDDILTAQLVTNVLNGILSLNNDGSFTYTPQANFAGDDTFTYVVNDGTTESNQALVTLTVSGINDPPAISAISNQVMLANTAISDIDFSITDQDSSLYAFTVSAQSSDQAIVPDANITINDLGVDNQESKRSLTILPQKDQSGTIQITITVMDDSGGIATTSFDLDVRPKSNPPNVRYYMLNEASLNFPINIVSLDLDNQITFGTTTINLNLFDSKTITPQELAQAGFVKGSAISGTAFFTIGQSGSGTNMLVPESFSGTSFVIPHIRYSHKYFILSPYGDASVHIKNNNQDTTITIAKGEVAEFEAGNINPDSSTITSSVPVLISHKGYYNTIPYDVYPVPPASTEIFGLHNKKTVIGALEDNTSVTVYVDNGTTTTFTLNANEYYEIEVNGTLDALGNALHIVADKPVAAVQSDDPNGSTASAFFDKSYFGNKYGVPINAENIIVIFYDPELMLSLLDKEKWPVIEALENADGNTPGKFVLNRQALPSFKANLDLGNQLLSSKPIFIIYDTQTDEERHNVLGTIQPE